MINLKETYTTVVHQDLIWRDMDAFQHVNNAVYFRYFEDVRIAYFEKKGINEYFEKTRVGPILASTTCDFRAPLIFPDKIQVATKIENIRTKRFTMSYVVYSEKLEKVAAEGEGLVVYYDYNISQSCEIPAEILSAMKQ